MKLSTINIIEGEIELITGLHIGAGNDQIHIGGIDNPVIKHPYTLQPYIPGSSLKGKMRSLMEWRAGIVSECEGKPISSATLQKLSGKKKEQAEQIARLFGLAGDSQQDEIVEKIGPTRLSFWDCSLVKEWIEQRQEQAQVYTEAKFENSINRISGTANNPRQTERVPAGARFQFKCSLKQLTDGDEILNHSLLVGLKLLEQDNIGGSGSRGYGKIHFNHLTMNDEPIDEQFAQIDPFADAD